MSNQTRRRFLQQSAALLGLAALPLPGWGAGPVAPGPRINLGMIGLGHMARGHLDHALGHPELQVVGICEVHAGRRDHHVKQANDKYAKSGKGDGRSVRGFKDYRELLQMPDLDAVMIATPDHWHALIAVAACEAGKDVYCEKPLALTHHEGRMVADAAKRNGTVFQVGSQQRSEAAFRKAAEIVRNGGIGTVREVWVDIGNEPKLFCDLPAQPVPEGLDWDFWIGPSQWRPYHEQLCPDGCDYGGWPNWRGYAEFGGGGQADFGAHHYDIAQWGLGMDDSGPVEVIPPQLSDKGCLTYTYANGVKMYRAPKVPGGAVTWIGDKGWVSCNRGDFLKTEPSSLADLRFGLGDVRLYRSSDHKQNWIDCIRSRGETVCTAEIGHRTATVVQLGNIAYRLGRRLDWDPKRERFVGDDAANRFLRREMRAPWTL